MLERGRNQISEERTPKKQKNHQNRVRGGRRRITQTYRTEANPGTKREEPEADTAYKNPKTKRESNEQNPEANGS